MDERGRGAGEVDQQVGIVQCCLAGVCQQDPRGPSQEVACIAPQRRAAPGLKCAAQVGVGRVQNDFDQHPTHPSGSSSNRDIHAVYAPGLAAAVARQRWIVGFVAGGQGIGFDPPDLVALKMDGDAPGD